MINLSRVRWAVDELQHDEEYIQWVGRIMIRVSVRDGLIYLAVHNDAIDKYTRTAFTREELEHSVLDSLPFQLNKMLKELELEPMFEVNDVVAGSLAAEVE